MALIVQKFGGTSVADIEKIQNVAKKIISEKKNGNHVIVVVSAMSGVTNQLVSYIKDINADLNCSENLLEYDSILSSGEQVVAGLLALYLQTLGFKSRSFLGWQIPITTNAEISKARILDIESDILQKEIDKGFIPVVAGFQGVSNNRITTLGRGGSDTSAIALAAKMKADRCDIYTDVEGVFTTDPGIVSNARKLQRISYEEMFELSSLGAKVLQVRSVEMAMKYNVRTQVRSSFSNKEGTILVNNGEVMERRLITGIAHLDNQVSITLTKIVNTIGKVAQIFSLIAENKISVDMIIQDLSYKKEYVNITFSIGKNDINLAENILQQNLKEIGYEELIINDNLVKLSVVGIGMSSHFGVASKMFQILQEQGINILAITTSEIKISVLIEQKYIELAIRSLHEGFALDK